MPTKSFEIDIWKEYIKRYKLAEGFKLLVIPSQIFVKLLILVPNNLYEYLIMKFYSEEKINEYKKNKKTMVEICAIKRGI